ncbi:selenide,water dikinase [Catalinimonas alkaloidigena]|uniref:selenide, water dikinase SelD n=1 Tax=Catalinimonas alkaloidigena TaxID=1075417 RepID=UPI0024052A41|nr:selenide, water dikinase SelD [Catalinimonas alkaloidigena]MDF9801131.1 selenide,water dikinase [Catalinimonas alkaloidigena]
MEQASAQIKLTQYSHGAGCGCKISPKILESMLVSQLHQAPDPRLLVGNSTKDDAAVYDMGNGEAVISTTDFFMPIVDDAFDFGQIASVNAISDIYAMGGAPIMAIAILGWPVNTIPAAVAQQVLEGSRHACAKAGIMLAGGHSIDSPEPIFGLAVTGRIRIENLKKNDSATPGCKLFLTKPLGVGILTTAQKKGLVKEADLALARNSMLTLNNAGEQFATLSYVKAMTDVTGFGLLGHLSEICEGSGVSALVESQRVPRFEVIDQYIAQKSMPGGTQRNFDSYGHKISPLTEGQKALLCDPQTSGGLLVAVEAEQEDNFVQFAQKLGLQLQAFGETVEQRGMLITVS